MQEQRYRVGPRFCGGACMCRPMKPHGSMHGQLTKPVQHVASPLCAQTWRCRRPLWCAVHGPASRSLSHHRTVFWNSHRLCMQRRQSRGHWGGFALSRAPPPVCDTRLLGVLCGKTGALCCGAMRAPGPLPNTHDALTELDPLSSIFLQISAHE